MTQNRLAPSMGHRLFFWFILATFSHVIPEVVTLNDPIPWIRLWGWIVGYPVYGLHVLALAGLMYRWPIAGYVTLLAYGGLFGLYEGYMIKQLWNPNWAMEFTASFGGVRLLHTLFLVFFVHPVFAFIVPLLVCELLLVAPGRLWARLPLAVRSWRGALGLLTGFAVYVAVVMGAKLGSYREIGIPLISIGVFAALGLVWRLVLKGHRYRLEDLLPRGRSLAVVTGLLFVSYPIYGSLLRPEAFPDSIVPHLTVWGIYLFLIGVIVAVTRNTRFLVLEDRPAFTNSQVFGLCGISLVCLLVVASLHVGSEEPGETIAFVSYAGGGVANILILIVCGTLALTRRATAISQASVQATSR